MSGPYSMDLRERLVHAVEVEGSSRRAAAKRFGVAASTAVEWLKRVATTGSAAPGQMGGHKPKAIAGAHRDWLVERCRQGDFTLRGLVGELADRGLEVDYHSVWDFVHAEGLTHKKTRTANLAVGFYARARRGRRRDRDGSGCVLFAPGVRG